MAYAQSPQQIAYAGAERLPGTGSAPVGTGEWEPLGVYALAQPGQTDSTTLFQLAINKDGVVRGNYMNQITNKHARVHGALNKETQQLSWSVGDNPETVFGTTLSDLMKDDSKVVVQFGPNDTKQMALIRQKPPADDNAAKAQTG